MAEYLNNENTLQVLTVFLGEQTFGIPILEIEDVLTPLQLTKVPLANDYIAGVSNLRGRIVTAISLRRRVQQEDNALETRMNVVVERGGELYSILVDRVGDVLTLQKSSIDNPPSTLNPVLNEVTDSVHQLDNSIMLILDVDKVITDTTSQKGNDYEILSYR